jgi:hypothetical protein
MSQEFAAKLINVDDVVRNYEMGTVGKNSYLRELALCPQSRSQSELLYG